MRGQVEVTYPTDRRSKVEKAISFAGPTVLGCVSELIVINEVEPAPLKFLLAVAIVAGTVALVSRFDKRPPTEDDYGFAYNNKQDSRPRSLEVPAPIYGYRIDHSYSPPMLQELVGYSSAAPSEPEN